MLIFVGTAESPAQNAAPQQPVFRTRATSVAVDVVVTDRKGHHITGLTASDFALYEDETLQRIVSFTPPPLMTETRHETPGRQITLVIDLGDLHPEGLKRACEAAAEFAGKAIESGNEISIDWVDASLHLGLPFTNDKQRAIAILEQLKAKTPAGVFTARERERAQTEIDGAKYNPAESGASANMLRSWLTTANAFQARSVFVALRALAISYRALPGRKTVVLFSEGFSHTIEGRPEIAAVIDAANHAGVAIYIIDAAGLDTNRPNSSSNIDAERAYLNPADALAVSQWNRDEVFAGMNEFDWVQTIGSDRHGDLGAVATATGGFLVKDTNDLAAALDRVNDDTSECYTLTYDPSNTSYDGAFRKIKVEAVKHGYHMRYRRGYWALPPGSEVTMTPAAAQLLAAVDSRARKPSFTPQLNAVLVPFADGSFGVSAAVSTPGNQFHFVKRKDQFIAGTTLLLIARDKKGGLLTVQEGYGDIQLDRSEHEAFLAKDYSWRGHVVLPELQPVNVQAVVLLSDGTLGVSKRTDLFPSNTASKLRLTSLVLSDKGKNSACDPRDGDPLCVKGGRILLPARPQFSRSTNMVVYTNILGGAMAGQNGPRMSVVFLLGSSADTLKPVAPKSFMALRGNNAHVYGVLANFDLQALQPGSYQLEVIAEDKLQQAHATERADFTVQ